MIWVIVAVSLAVIGAIRIRSLRYQQCPSCGARVRTGGTHCSCGSDLAARTRLLDADRARLVQVMGEDALAGVEAWLRAAHVREQLGWGAWIALDSAHKAMLARRMDLVSDLLDNIEELSSSSRTTLHQVAAGSVMIRNALADGPEGSAMTDKPNYPHSIELIVRHNESVPPLVMARAYVDALHEAGLGDVVELWMANSKRRPGSADDLFAALEDVGPDTHFLSFRVQDGTQVLCHRDRGTKVEVPDDKWHVEISRAGDPTEEWILAMTKIARTAITMPEFIHALLQRDGGHVMEFVPRPPLARSFHVVTVTDEEVAERYDDPAVFWRVWESVDTIGKVRLCTRHLDALDEEDWLARSVDDAMDLARHARPKLTWYSNNPYWYRDYAPWWEPGDPQDEKAGFPALTLVGYIGETKTVEFTGYVVKGRLHEGTDPRHVQIAEIHTVRELAVRKQTDDGRPVETVRVVFPEEWMARQERRPLLDVGARVYYMDGTTGEIVEVVD